MGDGRSVENVKRAFIGGFARKEQYTEALKGYQDAVDEMKSHDRDGAKAYLDNRRARSASQVAHSKALGPGITERASERPGKARQAVICRKFDSGLRQRVPFDRQKRDPRAADLRSCRAGRNWTGSSDSDEK
ncbi:hypothetical protein THAOC_30355 [Thalassiosira oceanica]|uniref:Uncharacterized protein n=1 Tax=Thalassiosira oceanica TaxID=159749 RepID=K0RBP5_THAOC|nr:hypothetical protein THAOC_30355 [Thalassiosira oceanica]|eukprot:EJK50610.1 hypothetical protein THAOC_30355 [Thalassiosira oceanica]